MDTVRTGVAREQRFRFLFSIQGQVLNGFELFQPITKEVVRNLYRIKPEKGCRVSDVD